MDKQIPPVSGEEVEVVAWLSTDCIGERYLCFSKPLDNDPAEELMTVAQHQRITDALLEDARYNYQLALDWQDKVIELQAQLAAAPAPVQAEPASPWVAVSERLPKKGEDVQVYCDTSGEQMVAFSLGDGRFQFAVDLHGDVIACRPTHWMPLPPGLESRA